MEKLMAIIAIHIARKNGLYILASKVLIALSCVEENRSSLSGLAAGSTTSAVKPVRFNRSFGIRFSQRLDPMGSILPWATSFP